jgi:hypothetical protein
MKAHFNQQPTIRFRSLNAVYWGGGRGKISKSLAIALASALMGLGASSIPAGDNLNSTSTIRGLTGSVHDIAVSVPAAERIAPVAASQPSSDIDLKLMAKWAMHYLIETPRAELGYEPVFQCHPLQCPPVPAGRDPIAVCDTDARMDWEWYYMREISGSTEGRKVEAAFHQRIWNYVDADGIVLASPGALNEDKPNAVWEKKDFIIHIWGATKILKSLAEDYTRTHNPESKALARKMVVALKKVATWDDKGRCWYVSGLSGLHPDGTPYKNVWNPQPAPIVESLVTYWLATGDAEALEFARAYADGMINNLQPGGIRFLGGNKGVEGGFAWGPHTHATMHAVWGIADLGVATDDRRYIDFAKGVWDWMLTRSPGTGWVPPGPESCSEMCPISDVISIAGLLGQAGHPEYFDYIERYMRNYVSPLQFILTPEFEGAYRIRNSAAGDEAVEKGLQDLKKFQGGIIGGFGLNDYENKLLGGGGAFSLYGCCAPEGMRAIYTTWLRTIERRPQSQWGPAGVYVNMSFQRESPWGRVVSFYPDSGRLTVRASVADVFYLRPPHWASRDQVRAFNGTTAIPVKWSGDYVCFNRVRPGEEITITYPLISFTQEVEGLWKTSAPNLHLTFRWLGNMVTDSSPAGGPTPLFTGKPRLLPPLPELEN